LGVHGKEIQLQTFDTLIKEIQIVDYPEAIDLEDYVRLFKAGKLNAYKVDARIITPQGDEKWISDNSVPIFDKKTKKVTGSLGVIQDISNRKKQELTLRTLEQRYRYIFELSPSGIMLEDDKGIIVEVNPAVCRSLRRSREELIGMDVREISMVSVEKVEDNIRRILSGEDMHHVEGTRMKDGTSCLMELHETCIKLTDNLRLILVITNDITERIHLENQLRHSQRMEAVGRMAGGVAHDFNNLLTVIRGYCELLLNKMETKDPNWHRIRMIDEAGQRAEAMTRQLLAFSRKQVLKHEVFDLNERIHDLTVILNRLIGEDISLKLNLSNKPALIRADAGQIDQVILNIVINARDAMPDGGMLLINTQETRISEEILIEQAPPEGDRFIKLSIIDNGFGMDDEVQKHIFEPYFTTREPGEGTGLGLSTVYGIIKQSGGFIHVLSEVNVGTTFEVYLPVFGKEKTTGEDDLDDKQKKFGGTETLFIVEDENVVRELLVESLSHLGYKISKAKDGVQAYERINSQEHQPDLLITDVVMPHMGGVELVEKLKKKIPDLKVLYISGYANLPAQLQKEIMSRDNFLQKPFTPQQLAVKVREMLNREG
jgi:PAS domain S-box-containing protein